MVRVVMLYFYDLVDCFFFCRIYVDVIVVFCVIVCDWNLLQVLLDCFDVGIGVGVYIIKGVIIK